MQQELAEQRSCEAALEKQRQFHDELGTKLSVVQGRFYELGAEVTRTEENIRYTSELRARHREDLTQTSASLAEVGSQILGDQERVAQLQEEIATLDPELERLRIAEQAGTTALAAADTQFADWQARWEIYNRELGGARQGSEVEAARIEQLDSQLMRLKSQADRLAVEYEALGHAQDGSALRELAKRETSAAQHAATLETRLASAITEAQQLRGQQHESEQRLEDLRRRRDHARAEFVSLDAVQQAALGEKESGASAWLEGFGQRSGQGKFARLASALTVEAGWERAVETVLGDYLEAVCLKDLDQLGEELQRLERGSLDFVEATTTASASDERSVQHDATLAARVRGPLPALTMLATVRTCDTLAQALVRRRQLGATESLVTPAGEWVGRSWLRLRRGSDPHAGVLERAQRLKQLGREDAAAEAALQAGEAARTTLRAQIQDSERARDEVQRQIQSAHREHAELRAQLGASQVRSDEAQQRRQRLAADRDEVDAEIARTLQELAQARQGHEAALDALQRLDASLPTLTDEREMYRERAASARITAQAAQLALRDILIRYESRRSTHESMVSTATRLLEQRAQLTQRHETLSAELADGDTPVLELKLRLQDALDRRLEVETDLAMARQSLEDADGALRTLEQRRLTAEGRVTSAREMMDVARMQAQESRVRRESLAEQFQQTRCDLGEVMAALSSDAAVGDWENRLGEVRSDIERLGPVNLAAIEELEQQSERKSYLDRQYGDVDDALKTLEDAMRRMDKETRTRFEDTFNRVNAGLKEKFPRLFGGGHAYLELVGDDPLAAGVAVMARPPGKRNSSISQLSGGEKALTAVALVFSIFDLNPAPFCLLDEVDAPLDEHNVGRFCDIVREMSGRVQFIFITHNKATMELASQLLGVTMNEPGVSRLVSVDVDAAVRLAAV
jgi:chromosome segregation protein